MASIIGSKKPRYIVTVMYRPTYKTDPRVIVQRHGAFSRSELLSFLKGVSIHDMNYITIKQVRQYCHWCGVQFSTLEQLVQHFLKAKHGESQ